MKIVHHSPAYYALQDKIPDIVAGLIDLEAPTAAQLFREVINEYTPLGSLCSRSSFCVDEDDLLDHIKTAKKRRDCTIDISDTVVTITRILNDGGRYEVTYAPMTV